MFLKDKKINAFTIKFYEQSYGLVTMKLLHKNGEKLHDSHVSNPLQS